MWLVELACLYFQLYTATQGMALQDQANLDFGD